MKKFSSMPMIAISALLSCSCSSTDSPCSKCDDEIACTEDICDEKLEICRNVPDDNRCPTGQVCDPRIGCTEISGCTEDPQCDDADPCTDDTCMDNSCVHQNICACTKDSDCEDQDPCTDDTCIDNSCVHKSICACSQDSDCDDSNPCSDDKCISGECSYDFNSSTCDDANPCTTDDICHEGQCNGTAIDCDDQNPCTDDSCDLQSGCINIPNSNSCNDQDPCTYSDSCLNGSCSGFEACCGDGKDNDADSLTDCNDPDCSTDQACGGCQQIPIPDPVPMAPLPGEPTPGKSESTTINGFNDDYIYDSTGEIKIGTRREWGGTIIFFGMDVSGWPGTNHTNTIDANDTGREVQVAFYDPDRAMQDCAWNASCATTQTHCNFSITFLGWNPVQGGNRCVRGSGIESVSSQDGILTISTNPLFWNPNWDRQDCSDEACDDPNARDRRSDVRVEQTLRFVRKNIVELQYTLTNLGDLDHRATTQEMPTIYTANGNNNTPDLWRLFNSEGAQIDIDTPGNDGFYYKNFTSPNGWATMQKDDLSYGVGLYSENRLTEIQGWQNRSLPFNNFRPVFSFAIGPHATVKARSYLIIGSKDTVTQQANWLDSNLAPFGWLDEPTLDQNVNGIITIRGWALDNKGISSMDVLLDGNIESGLTYGQSRTDVCLVWPAYSACPNVGFSGTLDTTSLTKCQHLLEIRATDTDANQRIIARTRIMVSQ